MQRRIVQLWNWLPAFRAVAETEHLPTAAEQLHVSPSALSRSVRLLEQELECSLFIRDGRRLMLSPAGRELLSAVRDSMARLDDSVRAVTEVAPGGALRIAAPSAFAAAFIVPQLASLGDASPVLEALPSVSRAESMLLEGLLDLWICDSPPASDGLRVEQLARFSHGVYCSSEHPLSAVESLPVEELSRWSFVGPVEGIEDYWPRELPRKVSVRVAHVHVAARVCSRGHLLALLPDYTAATHPDLVRLPVSVCSRTPIYAVYRERDRDRRALSALVRAITSELNSAMPSQPPKSGIHRAAKAVSSVPPPPISRPALDSLNDK